MEMVSLFRRGGEITPLEPQKRSNMEVFLLPRKLSSKALILGLFDSGKKELANELLEYINSKDKS